MPLITSGQSFEELLETTFPCHQLIEASQLPHPFQNLLGQDRRLFQSLQQNLDTPANLRIIELAHDQESLIRLAMIENETDEALGFRALHCNLEFFTGEMYTDLMACRLTIGQLLDKYAIQWNPGSRPRAQAAARRRDTKTRITPHA